VAESFVPGSLVTGVDSDNARSLYVSRAAAQIHKILLTDRLTQRTKGVLPDMVIANFLSNTVKKLLEKPIIAASFDSVLASLAAVYSELAPTPLAPATIAGTTATVAPATGAATIALGAAGAAAASAPTTLHWPTTAASAQAALTSADASGAQIEALERQLASLKERQALAASAAPSPAAAAALTARLALNIPVQTHLARALNDPSSAFRPWEQELLLLQAAFAIPGVLQPDLAGTPVESRVAARATVLLVILPETR
jgi:hypothetical protein